MELPFDIDNYHNVFNKYPKCLMKSEGRVYGQIFIGNYYKREHPYYGSYPPSYLKRMRALFGNRKPALHLFGGMVDAEEGEDTVDINPDLNPTYCCEATTIDQHLPNRFYEIAYVDPPYSKQDSLKYGFAYPNKKMVLRSCRKVIKENGICIWLDVAVPIFRKIEWNLIGMIGVFTGTNRVLRSAIIFQATTDVVYEKGLADLEIKN